MSGHGTPRFLDTEPEARIRAVLDTFAAGPQEREEQAEHLDTALATWEDEDVRRLGAALVDVLGGTAETAAKSFTALALIDVARRGVWDEAWTEPVLHWWTREQDQRGFDPVEGWIHAVAHGADLIGALVLSGRLPAGRALGACGRRLIAPTEFVWADGEDDRVALAICRALTCADATEATAWITRVGGYLLSPQPTPADPSHANSLRTLRSVLALLDQGCPAAGTDEVGPHTDAVRAGLLEVFAAATPWLWSSAPGVDRTGPTGR